MIQRRHLRKILPHHQLSRLLLKILPLHLHKVLPHRQLDHQRHLSLQLQRLRHTPAPSVKELERGTSTVLAEYTSKRVVLLGLDSCTNKGWGTFYDTELS